MENKNEQIDKFNSGEMTGAELEEFIKKMKKNSDLASQVKLNKEIDEFLKNHIEEIELREQLDQIHKEVILDKTNTSIIPMHNRNLFWRINRHKIAAGITLLIGIAALTVFTIRPPKNERLYAKYFSITEYFTTVRGAGNPVKEDEFANAMDVFNNGNYDTSFKLFSEVCISEPNNMKAFFYKGILAMENENFDEAIHSFNIIINDNKSMYVELAEWNLALSYLGKNDIPNTKIVLNKFIQNPDNFNKDKATTILKEIE